MAKEDVIASLLKEYSAKPTEYIPTGIVAMDLVLSDGKGYPKGKFIELASPSGYGKSTVMLYMAKCACDRGETVMYLDVEMGVNDSQIDGIGLRKYFGTQFILLTPTTFEEAEDIIDRLLVGPIKSDGTLYEKRTESPVSQIYFDSITALKPEKLVTKSVADIEPGLQARFCSSFLQKYKAFFERCGVTCWFINQYRTKISFRGITTTGAAGGNAQQFYMDLRLEMGSRKLIESTKKTIDGAKAIPYGAMVALYSTKNRHAPMEVPVALTILFGKGVSNIAFYSSWMRSHGYITGGGAGWWEVEVNGVKTKCRGDLEVNAHISKNLADIKKTIAESGGLKLVEGD